MMIFINCLIFEQYPYEKDNIMNTQDIWIAAFDTAIELGFTPMQAALFADAKTR